MNEFQSANRFLRGRPTTHQPPLLSHLFSSFLLFPLQNGKANGQPAGAQGSATTEDGAYTLNGATGGFVAGLNAVNPNTGEPPLFYIPREDEWCAGGD